MKNIRTTLTLIGLATGLAAFASAATMTGMISDSQCGASHAKMMEMHKGMKMTDQMCTQECIKAGAKYVFVANAKVYSVANQDFAALKQFAGENVSLTGNVKGDTVTVTKLAAKK